jgi:hypothetical protein
MHYLCLCTFGLGYILGDSFSNLSGHSNSQGDQIGRIFAHLAAHYFEYFCENYRNRTNNWATFFHSKSCVLIFTKMDWATFWSTFSQTHLVTLLTASSPLFPALVLCQILTSISLSKVLDRLSNLIKALICTLQSDGAIKYCTRVFCYTRPSQMFQEKKKVKTSFVGPE